MLRTPSIMAVLDELYGRRPIPFQTLNFRLGSEQRLHADSIHFDSVPSGLRCGVWVALEDVGPDQGPVEYVAGSHRLPPISAADAFDASGRFACERYEDVVAERTLGSSVTRFRARAGDVLIWSANVVHGGASVTDPRTTRASQVTHYFFERSWWVTPMASDPAAGEYALREHLIDISTGRRVRATDDGDRLRVLRLTFGRARILDPEVPAPLAHGSAPRSSESSPTADGSPPAHEPGRSSDQLSPTDG